jgi:hypothetical protein
MRYKTQKFFLTALIFVMSTVVFAKNPLITNYHQIFIPCYENNGQLRVAIRMYERKKVPYYLVVDPYSFETNAAPVSSFRSRKILDPNVPGYFTMAELKNTPYVKALLQYTAIPSIQQNYGLIRATNNVDGYFLTIDMCPSVKPFEKDFFLMLVKKSEDEHQEIPIGLSITGLWMIGHPDEFKWLVEKAHQHKLHIIWINHSYSHVYYADDNLPYSENFLLSMLVNIDAEVLTTEQLLLERGELPSVFIRFPGLISNDNLISKIQGFGLIPIGTDAWLAKGQQPTLGSIVLVHGNSNEHKGIKIAMPIVQPSSFHLLPLNVAFN